MPRVTCQILINCSVEAVWRVIGEFNTGAQYLSGVVNCSVEGAGIGAVRTLTNIDGSLVAERLEALDAVTYQVSYRLLTDTPFRNCLTTLKLEYLAPYETAVAWSATFEPEGLPNSEAVALLEGALAANCRALKQFMER